MKIVMLEPLAVPESVINEFGKKYTENGHEFTPCHKQLTENEKLVAAKNADILIVANSLLKDEVLQQAPNLKLISVGFTGVDHIPASYCIDNNVTVCNSQGYATIPTAELAVSLMLMRTRYIPETETRVRNGETKGTLVGSELSYKTVGIVGTGMIGRQTASLLKGFNVRLLGYDPFENDAAKELGIEYKSLEEVFTESDFISLHLPLLDSTKGLVNKELLSKMKKNSILINCARGPIVDSEALKEALNKDQIRGAGIDVFEIEPPIPTDHALFEAKNITVTPHIAFASKESMIRRAQIVFDNVDAYLAGTPINVMNRLK